MRANAIGMYMGFTIVLGCIGVAAAAAGIKPDPVNVDNSERVGSDLYFSRFVMDGALDKFVHGREPAPVDKQEGASPARKLAMASEGRHNCERLGMVDS